MKKTIYFITTLLLSAAVLGLSSCLKDSRNVDFGNSVSLVEFNLGGLSYFGPDAITNTNDLDTVQFAVSVASKTVPTTATTITLAVDNTIITSYVKANPAVNYLPFPDGSYKLSTTSVTIPAGQRAAIVTLVVDRTKIDATLSYMLPVKIASTTGGYTISGNMGVHYFHIIGNDLAGTYREAFSRWNASDSTSVALNALSYGFGDGTTTVILPVTPSEVQVYTQYASPPPLLRYDITFTKTGTGTAAQYTDLHVSFVSDDVTAAGDANITINSAPVFFDPATGKTLTADLAGPYKLAELQKLLNFQFIAASGGAPRYIKDQYAK